MKMGMAEKTVCIHNPLPSATEEELFEVAGLNEGVVTPANRSPFILEWRYSGGREREYIDLQPGETKQIRRTGAEMFVKANSAQGAIMFDPGTDKAEVLKASIEGCQKAMRFWSDRGASRIAAYRKLQGLTKEELEEQKYDVWPYFVNAARVKVLEKHIVELKKALVALSAPSTPSKKERAAVAAEL